MKKMNKRNMIIAAVAVVVVAGIGYAVGCSKGKRSSGKPEVEYFGAATCPFCQKATAFLDKVEASGAYKGVVITRHDVSTKEGMDKFMYIRKKCDIPSTGVPLTVFKDTKPCIYEVGFGEETISGEAYRKHIVALIEESKK